VSINGKSSGQTTIGLLPNSPEKKETEEGASVTSTFFVGASFVGAGFVGADFVGAGFAQI
jgi:hypothetical protein